MVALLGELLKAITLYMVVQSVQNGYQHLKLGFTGEFAVNTYLGFPKSEQFICISVQKMFEARHALTVATP